MRVDRDTRRPALKKAATLMTADVTQLRLSLPWTTSTRLWPFTGTPSGCPWNWTSPVTRGPQIWGSVAILTKALSGFAENCSGNAFPLSYFQLGRRLPAPTASLPISPTAVIPNERVRQRF